MSRDERDERDARDHVPAFRLAKQVFDTMDRNRGAGSTRALAGLPEDVVVIYGDGIAAAGSRRPNAASVHICGVMSRTVRGPFVLDNHAVQVVLRATVAEGEKCADALRAERDAARKEASVRDACLREAAQVIANLTRHLAYAQDERDSAKAELARVMALALDAASALRQVDNPHDNDSDGTP